MQSQGNRVALDAIHRAFEVREMFEWRGLGYIPHSGLKIRPEFAQFDAEAKFTRPNLKVAGHKACQ